MLIDMGAYGTKIRKAVPKIKPGGQTLQEMTSILNKFTDIYVAIVSLKTSA